MGGRRDLARVSFMELVVELVDFGFGFVQGLAASGGDFVNPALAPSDSLEGGFQETGALQSMQERVERTRTNAIAVMRQLLHHGQSEDGFVRRVHEHMNPNEPVKEFLLLLQHKINITPPARFGVGCYRVSI